MSLLSDLEKRIERMVEGIFSRTPTQVEAMDLARFLRKEMRDGLRSGLNRNYAPNIYEISLSPSDHRNLTSLGQAIIAELENYLMLEAQSQGWDFIGALKVALTKNNSLKQGEVDITAKVRVDDEEDVASSGARSAPLEPAVTQVIAAAPPHTSHHSAADSGWILQNQQTGDVFTLPKWGAMIGRSRFADVCIESLEVSRQHAQISFENDLIKIEDLESTNGTRVNGRKITEALISENDVIAFGTIDYSLRRQRNEIHGINT